MYTCLKPRLPSDLYVTSYTVMVLASSLMRYRKVLALVLRKATWRGPLPAAATSGFEAERAKVFWSIFQMRTRSEPRSGTTR